MAYPVVEQISQKVLTVLNSVKVANGYNYDLEIERPTRQGYKPEHLRGYLEQDQPSVSETGANNKQGWVQPYSIVVFIAPLEDDQTPIDTYINCICADLDKAIQANAQWDGLAIDTTIQPPAYFQDVSGELNGFEYHCDVIYRVLLDDPYAAAT